MTGSTAAAQTETTPSPDFADLYCGHAGAVHRFCLSQVGDNGTAEDLTHETFLRALHAGSRRPPDAEVRPWLILVARRLCIDHHRRHGRLLRLLANLQYTPPALLNVELVAEERELLHRVQASLQCLKRRERELIGLRVAADLSYREIAEILHIHEGAAKVATHRALTRLREHLQEAS